MYDMIHNDTLHDIVICAYNDRGDIIPFPLVPYHCQIISKPSLPIMCINSDINKY
jgi:hypothetical protein